MNKPTRVILVLFFGIFLMLFLWRRGSPPAGAPKVPVDSQQASRTQKTRLLGSREAWEERRAQLEVPYETPIQAAMLWSNAFPEQAVRYAALVDDKNVPIRFFGLCVDQDGKALEGVSLKMGVRQWFGNSPLDVSARVLKFDRVSGADGRFELSGVRGDDAGVDAAQKEGYDWIKKGSASVDFWGRRTSVPTANDPFVLFFWKKRGAEPLHVAKPGLRQKIATTGAPVAYDLKSGSKVEQSQNPVVQFAMRRNPESLPSQFKGNFDWQFTVEVPGGGVQTTRTNMPFLAPNDGYAAAASFGFKADDPQWSRETNAVLFFRTAQGQFGRMEVNVVSTTTGPEVSFGWTSYLNPTGSPVLEYEASQTIKTPPIPPQPGTFQPQFIPPPQPAVPGPSQPVVPAIPQPPPGFQALTNRGKAFAPPAQPRPQ